MRDTRDRSNPTFTEDENSNTKLFQELVRKRFERVIESVRAEIKENQPKKPFDERIRNLEKKRDKVLAMVTADSVGIHRKTKASVHD